MRRWAPAAAIWCVLAMAVAAAAQSNEPWERYLQGPRGPYRGKVIDAETRAPLVGAVVVARWSRDRVGPFHSVMENYAVREVVTDADGLFVINAKEVEERAPRRTWYPEFVIFMPGYGSFPRLQRAPRGFTGGVFEGAGTVVQLPRLESRDDRRSNLSRVTPNSFTDNPFTDLPELIKKINEERAWLGLLPLLPPEQR